MSGLGLTFLRRGGQAHPTAGSDYLKFKDELLFQRLIAAGISSDGVGITREDAAKVTKLPSIDWGGITSFNELVFFTGVTTLGQKAFYNNTSLTSIDLSNITSLGANVFNGCSALYSIGSLRKLETMGNAAFLNCVALEGDMYLDALTSNIYTAFKNTLVSSIIAPSVTSVSASQNFASCINLEVVLLGSQCSNFGTASIFSGTTSLKSLIFLNEVPPTLYRNDTLNRPTNCYIYVPDSSVEAYKVAENWEGHASYIKGVSTLQNDYPSIYDKVKHYL